MRKQVAIARGAFTIIEAVAAMAVVVVLMVVIIECSVAALRERARAAARLAATELAANVLEAARACPWDKLDKDWAARQTVPPDMGVVLPDGQLVVFVEPEKASPLARRVTVEVRWQADPATPPSQVKLVTILSARTTKKAGGMP